MLFKYALSLALAAGTLPSSGLASGIRGRGTTTAMKCNQDNCLRAIIGGAVATRQGSADCQAYFRTTVTPAIVTVTATATEVTSTTTSETEKVLTTTTTVAVIPETNIQTVTEQATITTLYTPVQGPVKKREATAIIPLYASACSGSLRYTSACLCVGATQTTVTATAPTITVTVVETSTDVSVISSTTTSVSTEVTSSTTTLLATTTTTSEVVVTSTIIPAAAIQTGQIYMNDGPYPGRFLVASSGYILYTESGAGTKLGITASGGQPYVISNPNLKLFLRGTGLYAGVMSMVASEIAATEPNSFPITCSLSPNKFLSCRAGDGFVDFAMCGPYLYLGRPSFIEQQPSCTKVTISVRL